MTFVIARECLFSVKSPTVGSIAVSWRILFSLTSVKLLSKLLFSMHLCMGSPTKLLFCAIFLRMSSQMVHFWRFFTRCLPIAFTMFVHVSERETFFSPNCSKFAVECDWNSKFLKMFKIWVFIEKIDGFFEKKLEFFFKIDKGDKFALGCASNGIIS